jgi:hypothetical protein
MKTGKQIEADLCKAGINALWIKGRGMIIMSAYYGVDCAVQGKYKIVDRETAESLIGADAEERAGIMHYASARGTYEVR